MPVQLVEELVRTIVKAMRAFQMYLPNNSIYQRAAESLRTAFNPVWANVQSLAIRVAETDLVWEDQVIYHQPHKAESFAWFLYKDGLRLLTLRPGVENHELAVFLQTVVRARLLSADAGDDLLTLLWEQDFEHLDYRFAEIVTETLSVLDPQAIEMGAGPDPQQQQQTQQKVRDDLQTLTPGMVDVDEFDSTLYFLDEREINSLKEQVDIEYTTDIRTGSIAAVLDIFELQAATAIREEVINILESIFPNLLNRGEFRTVAWLLREIRTMGGRVAAIDDAVRAKLDSFETRLSEPAILRQMLQVLDEASGLVQDDDMAELLRELRSPALEPLLAHLAAVKNEQARSILQSTADRIARSNPNEFVALLRRADSLALVEAIEVVRRVDMQQAIPVVGELVGHPDPAVRLKAVETLGDLGTTGALSLMEAALEDSDRNVRLAAVEVVGRRGYKGSLKRLEAVVTGKNAHQLERAEKRQFFEAYALVAGPNGLELLSDLLVPKGLFRRREAAETRTCAAYAVAKIKTAEARSVLERATQDKELSVRNAAVRALREWGGGQS